MAGRDRRAGITRRRPRVTSLAGKGCEHGHLLSLGPACEAGPDGFYGGSRPGWLPHVPGHRRAHRMTSVGGPPGGVAGGLAALDDGTPRIRSWRWPRAPGCQADGR